MNKRPKLQRPPVALPNYPGYNDALWETLLELANAELHEWTLIGGQMVLLHALEHGVEPTRVSHDIDVVVNARVVASGISGIRSFVESLESLGFSLAGASPDNIAHRYQRDRASIDVLAPERLGSRADLTTTRPGRTLEVPGGTQALARTELLPVQFNDLHGLVPRPSLLGAIVCKAAAVAVAGTTAAQQRDVALLLSLVADPIEVAKETQNKDRERLRDIAELADPDHRVWEDLPEDAADRARLAYKTFVGPATV